MKQSLKVTFQALNGFHRIFDTMMNQFQLCSYPELLLFYCLMLQLEDPIFGIIN